MDSGPIRGPQAHPHRYIAQPGSRRSILEQDCVAMGLIRLVSCYCTKRSIDLLAAATTVTLGTSAFFYGMFAVEFQGSLTICSLSSSSPMLNRPSILHVFSTI